MTHKVAWLKAKLVSLLWAVLCVSAVALAQAAPTGIHGDAEFWRQIATWLWVPLGLLIAITWQSLNKKIDDVRTLAMSALTKEEFERELKLSLRDREVLTRDVRELYSKVEAAKDSMNAKLESTRSNVMDELKEFRAEMTSALNSVRNAVDRIREP